jgi:hypothetical protein
MELCREKPSCLGVGDLVWLAYTLSP